MFFGFLPKKQSQILHYIGMMESIKKLSPDCVFVFYESPQRINQTLELFKKTEWNPDIAICREMTKKFEEVIRGKAEELSKRNYKGEITVVVK
jgi:16S rRNA (cytidine1402-2'-O)-methyltransferase